MIIFNGRHPLASLHTQPKNPPVHNSSSLSVGLNQAALGSSVTTILSGRVLTIADVALRACLAARVAASENLLALIVPQIRALSARHPQAALPRIARLVLENHMRRPGSTGAGLETILRLDDFAGGGALNPPDLNDSFHHSRDSEDLGFGQPNAGDQSDERRRHPEPDPPPETASGGQEDSEDSEDFLQALATPSTGRIPWQWFSFNANDWCSGGSIRIAHSQRDHIVNLDINVNQGKWQFHWAEPRRLFLYFAPPATDGAAPLLLGHYLPLLTQMTGGLGFTDFVEIQKEDWYDGFNFLKAATIIKRVDLFT